MARKKELSVDERISKKVDAIWVALSELSENKKAIVTDSVNDAAFKAVQLEILHEIIKAEGVIEEYQNGKDQKGRKVSSNVQVYNAMEKSYQSQVKILLDALPKDVVKDESDGFDGFVMNRD